MPAVDVVVENEAPLSIRSRQVCGMFDCPPQEKQSRRWTADIPLHERDWNIGLIVGPSGCGKTTIARNLWSDEYGWEPAWGNGSVIDDFPSERPIEEVAAALNAVGFSTVPAWLRPFHVLSNGEQFRAEIARRMIEQTGTIVVDEFTSVVDRQVATVACHAVQKFIRRSKRQMVAVTCHNDVIEWLQPNWVFEPATCEFTWRCLRRRPEITIELARLPYDAWRLFAPFHYMSADLHRAARCYGLWANGELAAFGGVLHRPHPKAKNIKGLSRMVTLPDWQGLGLAFVLMESLGAALRAIGQRFRIYPAHPSFIRSCRTPPWRLEKRPGTFDKTMPKNTAGRRVNVGASSAKQRPCAIFEYVGDAMEAEAARRILGN